ncbi:hypothetical protein [Streptomyces sp. T028]|uniref:Rv1733c family protein n=1 Tax=Streptomyces sp. T028 TaxID=3394379 RepID=UPI003A879ACA
MLKRNNRVLLWRWRHNPLKRRSDVIEAWIGVVAAAVMLLTAPAVGLAAAEAAEQSALHEARGLHSVTAELVEDAPGARPSRFSAPTSELVRVTVRWTTNSGSVVSATAPVAAGSKAGSATTVWLDADGRVQPTPPTPAQAASRGVALGAAAALGTSALVLGAWWVVRVRLDVRRRAWWERAWKEFDTQRGHRHA